MKNCGVYKIENLINHKVYIGSSVNLSSRKKGHFNALSKNEHHSIYLQRSYQKYGQEAFRFTIIEDNLNTDILLSREQFWIDFYKSYNAKYGYNICRNAGNTIGFKPSEELRKLWSQQRKGNKNGMFGKTHTQEARKIIAQANKRRIITDEFRKQMSKITKGEKNGMSGRVHKEETKKIISEKIKERGGLDGENNPNYGHRWNNELKDKIRETIKNNGGRAGSKNSNFGNFKIEKKYWQEIYQLCSKEKYGNKTEAVKRLSKKYEVSDATIYKILNLYEETK